MARFTLYACITDEDASKCFNSEVLESKQTQKAVIEAMILFCKDNGFKMPKKETHSMLTSRLRYERKRARIEGRLKP